MRITKVSIKNIMALSELEIKPGKIETVVEGANAVGKTSLLNAIRAALGSGHDASLIRKGEKTGEVVIVLDDGTEITKRITETKSDTKVKLQEMGRISTPMRYIDSLLDGFSLNPVEFLTVPAKRRADLLLESLPLTVTVKQVNECLPRSFQIAELDKHPLDVITDKRKEIYDERTGTNRVAKTAAAAADEAKKALPAEAEQSNWDILLKEKEDELRQLESEFAATVRNVETGSQTRMDEVRTDIEQRLTDIRVEAQDKIAVLNKAIESLNQKMRTLEKQISEVQQQASEKATMETRLSAAAIDVIRTEVHSEVESLRSGYNDNRKALVDAVADIRSKRDVYLKAQSLRDLIKQREKEALTNEKASEILSASLDKLDVLKESLLDALPIKGVEVRNGEVFVFEDSVKDFVPFDRANEARKIRIAIEVAKVRAKASKVPLIIADGMERLDTKQFELFEKELAQAQEEGFQVIVARVTDQQGLTVRSVK